MQCDAGGGNFLRTNNFSRRNAPSPTLPRMREREFYRSCRESDYPLALRPLSRSSKQTPRRMRSVGRRGSHRLRIRRRFAEKALITFPFHDPPPDRAMTVADKLRVEHRRAPCAPGCDRRRMRRAHDPSRLRGGRRRRRRDPQHQSGDAGGLRGQRQLAAGDEIELPRLAPDLQHDGAERIAGERIGGGRATRSRRRRAHASPADADRGRARQARSSTARRIRVRKNPAAPTPAAAARVTRPASPAMKPVAAALCRPSANTSCIAPIASPPCSIASALAMAERDPVERMRIAMRLEALDAAAQRRKRACACAAHAPLPRNFWPLWF